MNTDKPISATAYRLRDGDPHAGRDMAYWRHYRLQPRKYTIDDYLAAGVAVAIAIGLVDPNRPSPSSPPINPTRR